MLAQHSAPTSAASLRRVAPYFGPTQRFSSNGFPGESSAVFLDVGSLHLERRSPHPGHESRRNLRRSPEPPTPQQHSYGAVASFIFARVSTSFTSRPWGGDWFEVLEGKHQTQRFRLKLDSAFRSNSGARSTPFAIQKKWTRLATSSPFSTRSTGRTPSPVNPLLPPTRALFSKSSTGSAGPLSSSRTPLHVRRAPSAPVEQVKPGTAGRASSASTASGQINRTAYSLYLEGPQLSSSRTRSDPAAPFGPGQRSSGALRERSGDLLPTGNGGTQPSIR